MKKKKYWYMFHIRYCPVCGYEEKWKERVYDKPKPKDDNARYDWQYMQNHYCWAIVESEEE